MTIILLICIFIILLIVYFSKRELFTYTDLKLISNSPIETNKLKDSTVIKGTKKKAFLFNKNDSYISLKNLDIKNDFTISLMIRLNQIGNKNTILHTKNNNIHIEVNDGICSLTLTFKTNSIILSHPYKLSTNKWYNKY